MSVHGPTRCRAPAAYAAAVPKRPPLPDLLLAVGLCVVGLVEVLGLPIGEDVVRGSTALNVAAVALTCLPLALRRQAPLTVAGLVVGAIASRALAGPPLELYPTLAAAVIAVYSVAAYASTRDTVLALGLFGIGLAVAAERGTGGPAAPELIPSMILAGGVVAVGRVARGRHERALAVERDAERRAATAAADERARLARELHDAVSHSLASIVMQAGGAQDVLARDPERAARALASIEDTARGGLGEMRRLLGLLGPDDGGRAPQPGLARLDELVDGARAAGLDVAATVEGDRPALPPVVDLSAYRILQEALTNAMKHGGRCRASVRVRYAGGAVELEVADDGRGPGAPGSADGRGLAGMRERVRVLGGDLETGPGIGGRGFRVRARLPAEPAA
jgi:signal transduction histidine kinase